MNQRAGLAEVVLWVGDMEAALRFYRDLFGFAVISPAGLPNKFLQVGEGADGVPEMIVLVPHPDRAREFSRDKLKRVLHHIAVRLPADQYSSLADRFRAAGLEVRGGVHPVLKGVRTFYVDDPDGNEVEIIAHDPSHGQATKAGYEPQGS